MKNNRYAIVFIMILIANISVLNAQIPSNVKDSIYFTLAIDAIFEKGSSRLKPESLPSLWEIKNYLSENWQIMLIRVEGHCYTEVGYAANQQLSEKRALIIAKWLFENGIDCTRVVAIGLGNSKPTAAITTFKEKVNHERITIVKTSMIQDAYDNSQLDQPGIIAIYPCN